MFVFLEAIIFWLCFAVGATVLLFGGEYQGLLG